MRASGLQGPTAPMPTLEHVIMADRLCVAGIAVAVGDMVCKGPMVGRVLACCFDNTVHGVVVDRLRAAPGTHPLESKFMSSGASVEVWLMDEVEPCVAWTEDESPCTVIFHALHTVRRCTRRC